jgi:hypothetical protein
MAAFSEERTMKPAALGLLALLAAGCAGRTYPDTDVVEPAAFELKVATGIQKSLGLLQAGTLEYAGAGDLVAVYRDYVAAMKSNGWAGVSDEIQGQKAVGTLRKDNRTCSLEFTSVNGQIRIVVKVGGLK